MPFSAPAPRFAEQVDCLSASPSSLAYAVRLQAVSTEQRLRGRLNLCFAPRSCLRIMIAKYELHIYKMRSCSDIKACSINLRTKRQHN